MTEKILQDRNGSVIGIINDTTDGITELIDRSGILLGFYDSVEDKTRDSCGILVGNGNKLLVPWNVIIFALLIL